MTAMLPLETLVRDHHALVFRVALGVLRDAAGAEDVAQDVFVHVFEHPEALAGAVSVRAVLARAARNRALNARRGEKRREGREIAVNTSRREAPDPAEEVFRGEVRARVAALPEDQRSAVDLHYFQGLTLPECAAALEIPEGTVSSRISTALRQLRAALAGAATAALLAALESELSSCGAEELPAGLEGRLRDRLRARREGLQGPRATAGGREGEESAGPSGSARRKPAALAAGTALLVLLAVWLGWTLRGAGSDGPGARTETASAGAPPRNGDASAGAASSPSTPPSAEQAWPVRTADGFLMRAHGGLTLAEPDAGALGGALRVYSGAIPDFPEIGRAGGWKFAEDPRLAGLAAAGTLELRPFLKGDASASPPPTRLRVRARLLPGDGIRVAELVEILEVESLSADWWAAWRDLLAVRREFDAAWDTLPPGPARRSTIVRLAESAAAALARARSARADARAPRRAVTMENDLAGFISARLEAVGLGSVVPASPDAWALHDALMNAPTAAALRARVVQAWGEEALWLEAWAVRPWGEGEQGMQGAIEIGVACAMPEDKFRRLHEDMQKFPGNRRRALSLDAVEVAARRERSAALGLEIAPVGPLERERLLLEKGVLVVSAAPGSPAALAGLRAGDVIWRARRAGAGSPDVVLDEIEAADLAERWAAGRADGTRLDVVRDEQIETLTLGR